MSTLTPQGQVTIPSEIRERLGLVGGIRLRINIDADGKIVLAPEGTLKNRPSIPEDGLAGLAGLWSDGEEFADEVEQIVAHRTLPRPLDDIE